MRPEGAHTRRRPPATLIPGGQRPIDGASVQVGAVEPRRRPPPNASERALRTVRVLGQFMGECLSFNPRSPAVTRASYGVSPGFEPLGRRIEPHRWQ